MTTLRYFVRLRVLGDLDNHRELKGKNGKKLIVCKQPNSFAPADRLLVLPPTLEMTARALVKKRGVLVDMMALVITDFIAALGCPTVAIIGVIF